MPGPSHTSSSNRQVGHDEWLCIHARMHGSWYRWPHGSRSAPSATGSWQMAQSAARASGLGSSRQPRRSESGRRRSRSCRRCRRRTSRRSSSRATRRRAAAPSRPTAAPAARRHLRRAAPVPRTPRGHVKNCEMRWAGRKRPQPQTALRRGRRPDRRQPCGGARRSGLPGCCPQSGRLSHEARTRGQVT